LESKGHYPDSKTNWIHFPGVEGAISEECVAWGMKFFEFSCEKCSPVECPDYIGSSRVGCADLCVLGS